MRDNTLEVAPPERRLVLIQVSKRMVAVAHVGVFCSGRRGDLEWCAIEVKKHCDVYVSILGLE